MKHSLSIIPVLFLLMIALMIVPVAAKLEVTGGNIDIAQTIWGGDVAAFSYTCDPDEKIAIMEYDIPINTRVDFTYFYGTSSTVAGYMIYRPAGVVGQSYSEVSIGGNTFSETFIDAQVAGYALTRHVQFVSYARNSSTEPVQLGFAVYAQGYGVFSNEIAFYPVNDITQNMIYAVTATATQPVTMTAITNKADRLAQFIGQTTGENVEDGFLGWIDRIKSYILLFWSIFSNVIYWLKFLFVDNIVLTFSLYFSGTMAFSMLTAKNIFDFYQKFFGLQKAFIEFMIGAFNTLVQMITAILSFFKII